MKVATAHQQLNGTRDVSVRLLAEAQHLTGDPAALAYLAEALGYLLVPRAGAGEAAGDPLLHTLGTGAEYGDLAQLVPELLADGRLTPEEALRAEKEITDVQARAEQLRRSLRARVQ